MSPPSQRTHPIPTTGTPAGLDPASIDSGRQFVVRNHLPSGEAGRFNFALLDEHNDFASVRLRHGLAGHRQPPTFTACAGGLHVIELHAPAVNRIEYRFGLVDHEGHETIITDPLNHDSVSDPFATRSVITTAAYGAPAYVTSPPAEAVGTLKEVSINGPLENRCDAWVWQPPGAKTDAILPVIVFLDGGDWLRLTSARNMLENLVHQCAVRPCRAVFIKPDDRNVEYAANPKMAEYLARGLGTAMSDHILWPTDATQRAAVGVSLGALCLLFTHFTQPAAFGSLLLQSGSFFQPQTDAMETGYPFFIRLCGFVGSVLDGSLANSVPRIPIAMTCGAGEENLVNNNVMFNALREQGFRITFHEQPDAHNWTCWRDSVGEGLIRLLAP